MEKDTVFIESFYVFLTYKKGIDFEESFQCKVPYVPKNIRLGRVSKLVL